VLLQEAFSDWHRKMILRATVEEYPFQSQVLGRDRGFRQDGGVVLLSKWPIEVESQTLFGELCARKDCRADKGVLYARINKQGRRFHVFATHLQSGKANWETRRQQLETLRRLIEQKQLPADEPVLIGGDLNVDSFADAETGDFSSMLRILDASHPAPPEGAVHQPTVDPAGNRLAGGAAPRHVDYVLHSNDHLRPITAFNAVRRLFVGDLPLSDHYAVHGSFAFEQQPLLSEAPSKQHDSRSAIVDSFSKTTN
jgi:endonuclease/exonuclease/phosphatase family metal-dependent hydrolase